jgi:fumarate hydratase class II
MNPTQAEALNMIAVQAMASDLAVRFGSASGHLERNVCKPLMIASVLQSVAILSGGCRNFRKYLMVDTPFNHPKIDESLVIVNDKSTARV